MRKVGIFVTGWGVLKAGRNLQRVWRTVSMGKGNICVISRRTHGMDGWMDGKGGLLFEWFNQEHSVSSGAGQKALKCGQWVYEYEAIEPHIIRIPYLHS